MKPNETALQAEAMVDEAILRLMDINWNSNFLEYKNSYQALVHEYMRRLAFWYMALGQDKTGESFKAFDLPAALLPLPQFAQEKIDSGWVPHHAEERGRDRPDIRHWQYELCNQYLHWTAIEATPEVRQYGLLSPYEPLMMLYERGSDFKYGTVGIEITPLVRYFAQSPEEYLHARIIDLRPEALDALDIENENKVR